MKSMSRIAAVIILLTLTALPGVAQADTPPQATIYFNEACGDCREYIETVIVPILQESGITDIAHKDYINEPENRLELVRRSEELGVPAALQAHFTTFVGERLVLEGHVPAAVIRDLLAVPQDAFERMVVYQDKMMGATHYQAWAFAGEVREYPIDAPIAEYLSWYNTNRGRLSSELPGDVSGRRALLPLVLASGFLDGFNPCAFAVLLFFIAFLFTIRRTKSNVFQMGAVYIGGIYLTYFLIGLGLLKAITLSGEMHFMAKVGSWLVIGLGLINLKDFLFPGLPVSLRVPTIAHGTIQNWLQKATLPAAATGGVLVGLCTFPCSGGIYVAIIGLLSAQATYLRGLGYLSLYNLMFVLPLVVVLAAVANRRVLHQIRVLERSQSRRLRLLSGLVMMATGVVILIWFV